MQEYDTYVPVGEEASLQYTFVPDSALPQLEFQVAVHLFYQHQEEGYSSTVFNKTVDVIEVTSFIDFQLLGLWALVFAVLGVGGELQAAFKTALTNLLLDIRDKRTHSAKALEEGEDCSQPSGLC